jgi:hypothetical protein
MAAGREADHANPHVEGDIHRGVWENVIEKISLGIRSRQGLRLNAS